MSHSGTCSLPGRSDAWACPLLHQASPCALKTCLSNQLLDALQTITITITYFHYFYYYFHRTLVSMLSTAAAQTLQNQV